MRRNETPKYPHESSYCESYEDNQDLKKMALGFLALLALLAAAAVFIGVALTIFKTFA